MSAKMQLPCNSFMLSWHMEGLGDKGMGKGKGKGMGKGKVEGRGVPGGVRASCDHDAERQSSQIILGLIENCDLRGGCLVHGKRAVAMQRNNLDAIAGYVVALNHDLRMYMT